MKVAINDSLGGFRLSEQALKYINEKYNCNLDTDSDFRTEYVDNNNYKSRIDIRLIDAIESLKELANGDCALLKIIEIPDNVYFIITDYDGIETIHYSESKIISVGGWE